jgi:hypothetical protein
VDASDGSLPDLIGGQTFAHANAARLAVNLGLIKFHAASLAPGLRHDAYRRPLAMLQAQCYMM